MLRRVGTIPQLVFSVGGLLAAVAGGAYLYFFSAGWNHPTDRDAFDGEATLFGALCLAFSATTVVLTTAAMIAERWYRGRHGLCRRCGYDLRASVETCPECGTPKV